MKRKLRVLSIDDDVSFNKLMGVYLKKLDYEFRSTQFPRDFLYELKVFEPDICFIDLNLDIKQGAGFQLIEAIRTKLGPELPVIVLSRRNSKEDIAHAFELGATDYLSKPIDDFSLEQKIKIHVGQGPGEKNVGPLYLVSSSLRQCEFELNVEIDEIKEEEIVFKSKHFFAKGSYLKFDSDFFIELFGKSIFKGTVYKNWIDPETKDCFFSIHIELENDDIIKNLRHWILNKNKELAAAMGKEI